MSCATPPARGTVARVDGPSLNVRDPVGVAPPVTTACSSTVCPKVEGFGDDVSEVVVADGCTVWVRLFPEGT